MTDNSTWANQFLALSSDPIFGLSRDFFIQTGNPSAERFFGYKAGAPSKINFLTFIDDSALERVRSAFRVAEQAGEARLSEWVGKEVKTSAWLALRIVSLPELPVQENKFLVYAVDQTAEHSARELDDKRWERLRLAVESVQDYAILTLDPEGRVASWNLGAQRIKGYSAEEIIGQHFSKFYPKEDVDNLKTDYELKVAIEEGKYEEEGWRVKKDNSVFWASVTITALKDEAGTLSGFGKVTRDLTARRHAEEMLRQSQQRYKLMVDNVTDYAILSLDTVGRITTWNNGARQLKGYSAEEIIGTHFSKFYPEEDLLAKKPERELREATANGRFEDEGWRIRKDGSRFWANVILTALRDESGRLIGFGKITKDMTERKRYEEELKKQGAALGAANKELEAFSYSVSHDLRSPLRGIDGFSQALLEDYDTKLDEEGRKYLQYIRAGTQKMGRLIDDLLNLSRMTRSEMTVAEVSLTELARNIEASLRAASPDREVLVDIQEGLRAEGDRGLLNVMLENLISNAWKFTAKKENASIEFGSELRGEECVFFIRDNGAGFDMKYYDKLFGAFQRLHSEAEYRGTGVGLATVRRIVTRHAGQIWAESTVGEGTTFFFTL